MQSQIEGLFFIGKGVACFCEMKRKVKMQSNVETTERRNVNRCFNLLRRAWRTFIHGSYLNGDLLITCPMSCWSQKDGSSLPPPPLPLPNRNTQGAPHKACFRPSFQGTHPNAIPEPPAQSLSCPRLRHQAAPGMPRPPGVGRGWVTDASHQQMQSSGL